MPDRPQDISLSLSFQVVVHEMARITSEPDGAENGNNQNENGGSATGTRSCEDALTSMCMSMCQGAKGQ